MIAALLLAVTIDVPVVVAGGERLQAGRVLEVDWRDPRGRPMDRVPAEIVESALRISRPAGASRLRVAGPDFMSREMDVEEARRVGLTLFRPVELRVTGDLSKPDVRIHMVQFEGGQGQIRDVTSDGILDSMTGGRILRLPPGQYQVAVDLGRARPFAVSKRLDCRQGQHVEFVASSKAPVPRPYRLCVRNRNGGFLRGASLVVPEKVESDEQLLVRLLALRAGSSGGDGVLDLGAIHITSPLVLPIAAAEHRTTFVTVPVDVPDGPIPTVLVPWPDLRVTMASTRLPGKRILLERCSEWSLERRNCIAGWSRFSSVSLNDNLAVIRRVRPGKYSAYLEGIPSTKVLIDVPDDRYGPGVIDVTLPMEEFLIRGRTVTAGGDSVAALVSVVASHAETKRGGLIERVESSHDGWFEAEIWGVRDEVLVLHAARADGSARTRRGVRVQLGAGSEPIEIRLDSSAVVVRLEDRGNRGNPVAGCLVDVESREGDSSLSTSVRTDSQGTAVVAGVGGSTVRVSAACEGFVSNAGTVVEVETETRRSVTIQLDRIGKIRLSAMDSSGGAVSGASVFALPAVLWEPPYGTPVMYVGTTGPDGVLNVAGDRFGGLPVFVFGPESALTVSRLPSVPACETSCEVSVSLHPKAGFQGLTATTASGRVLAPEGITFWKNGIPIVLQAIEEMIKAQAIPAASLFSADEPPSQSLIPALLGPGDYELRYIVRGRAAGALGSIPLGHMLIPGSGVQEARAMAIP